ncbi:unnamed protein product, partial [Brenthis ino]
MNSSRNSKFSELGKDCPLVHWRDSVKNVVNPTTSCTKLRKALRAEWAIHLCKHSMKVTEGQLRRAASACFVLRQVRSTRPGHSGRWLQQKPHVSTRAFPKRHTVATVKLNEEAASHI